MFSKRLRLESGSECMSRRCAILLNDYLRVCAECSFPSSIVCRRLSVCAKFIADAGVDAKNVGRHARGKKKRKEIFRDYFLFSAAYHIHGRAFGLSIVRSDPTYKSKFTSSMTDGESRGGTRIVLCGDALPLVSASVSQVLGTRNRIIIL